MENLTEYFVQFSNALAKFVFLEGRLGTINFDLLKISSSPKIPILKFFRNLFGNSYIQFPKII